MANTKERGESVSARLLVVCGPSSAGKTTLCRALLKRNIGAWVYVPIDALLTNRSAEFRDPSPLFRAYVEVVGALLDSGVSVIADVVFERGVMDPQAFEMRTARVPRLIVELSADPGVLDARERARGDRAAGLSERNRCHLARWPGPQRDFDTAATSAAEIAARLDDDLAQLAACAP